MGSRAAKLRLEGLFTVAVDSGVSLSFGIGQSTSLCLFVALI